MSHTAVEASVVRCSLFGRHASDLALSPKASLLRCPCIPFHLLRFTPPYNSAVLPGGMLFFTANILPDMPAVKPSTCRAYCSICLEFSNISNLLNSGVNLNILCHSSSGRSGCFVSARVAFSAFLFVCQLAILFCSLAICRWLYW